MYTNEKSVFCPHIIHPFTLGLYNFGGGGPTLPTLYKEKEAFANPSEVEKL
jgi:hypothetical protein